MLLTFILMYGHVPTEVPPFADAVAGVGCMPICRTYEQGLGPGGDQGHCLVLSRSAFFASYCQEVVRAAKRMQERIACKALCYVKEL